MNTTVSLCGATQLERIARQHPTHWHIGLFACSFSLPVLRTAVASLILPLPPSLATKLRTGQYPP